MREWVPELKATSVWEDAPGRMRCIGGGEQKRRVLEEEEKPRGCKIGIVFVGKQYARRFGAFVGAIRGRNAAVKMELSVGVDVNHVGRTRRTFQFKRRRLQAGIARLQRTVLPRRR